MKRLIALITALICILAVLAIPMSAAEKSSTIPLLGANTVWYPDDMLNENNPVVFGLEYRNWYHLHEKATEDDIPCFKVTCTGSLPSHMLYFRYYSPHNSANISQFYPTIDILEYRYMVFKYKFTDEIPNYNRQIQLRIEAQNKDNSLYSSLSACRDFVQRDNSPKANVWTLDIIDTHREVLTTPEKYDADPDAIKAKYMTNAGTIPLHGFDFRPFLSSGEDFVSVESAIPENIAVYVAYIGFFKTPEEAKSFDESFMARIAEEKEQAKNTTAVTDVVTTEPDVTTAKLVITTTEPNTTTAQSTTDATTAKATERSPSDTTQATPSDETGNKNCGGFGIASVLAISLLAVMGTAIIKKHW